MRLPSPARIRALLYSPLPYEGRPLPIAERDPDPGLFGPGSITWEVLKEPLLVLGSGRGLLLQAAHPLVAQGAIEHSAYASDPFGRFQRTLAWVTVVAFGTTAEARAAVEQVNRIHHGLEGRLPAAHATPRVPAGTPYSALDPELLRWVFATLIDTLLVTHDALVGGLDEADRDRFVDEWRSVARMLHVPARLLWRDHGALRAYLERSISRRDVAPGPGSRLVARTILHPPLPSPALRPLWDLVAFTTVGLLPGEVRRSYGMPWSPAHDAAHCALRLWLRGVHPVLPRRLRISPVYDFAGARAAARLRASAA